MSDMHLHHEHQTSLVFLSVIIAIFASYTALDLVNSISTSKGRIKWIWLFGSSLAMGVGIWSMHFVGMLAFRLHGVEIYYDFPLLLLSILVAIIASALALWVVSSRQPNAVTYFAGSVVMGAAIAGMHYIGIASMRLNAIISWNWTYVVLSVIVALVASYIALFAAFMLRNDLSIKGFMFRGLGGVILGFAIAGMHYTGMMAMHFTLQETIIPMQTSLLATDGLASAIIIGTLVILGIALSGSNLDRALSRKTLHNELLQQGISSRDEFLSMASHEIRTPLTSIKLQTELALRHLNSGKIDEVRLSKMLEHTNHNIKRLSLLVDDMLDISRLSNQKLQLQKSLFDLGNLIGEIIDRFQPHLQEAGCTISYDSKKNVQGEWDQFRIEQVMINLLNNAVKYAPHAHITVILSTENKFAVLSVKDNGDGISAENQERIFQRFERVKSKDSQSGLGLGLYIVKEILALHGGDIKLKSEINQGAEFVVTLPLV